MNDNPKPTHPSLNDEEAAAEQLADTAKHAADVTREQIKHIYEQNESGSAPAQKQPLPAKTDEPAPASAPKAHGTYGRTHKSNYDWREYHSAWQTYYQEYYRRYYHHINSKKTLEQGDEPATVTGDDSNRVEELKQDVVTQVKRQAKKIKHSHHFWPLITAAAVGVAFLFLQFNSIAFAQIEAYVSPGALEGQKLVITDPSGSTAVGPESRLIIPKINVDIPTNFDINTLKEEEIQTALQDGAVHYKLPGATAMPGQFGNSVILGHSSNDVFARGQYKFAFVLTDQLVAGDTFYVHYKGTRYTYKVTEKKIIKPEELKALQIGNDKPMVTLVTCTPAGTALNRLLVYGEQINPDPAGASKADKEDEDTANQQILPGNAPTLLEQLLGLFF